MNIMQMNRRTLLMIAVLAPLFILFIYVGMTSGPLAPVSVTTATVESRSISPALFGIGTIEARYAYKIGPTAPGRLKEINVDVGDSVEQGQLLGKMNPIDLDDRITAQDLSIKRAKSAILVAKAQVNEALARSSFAQSQANRYKKLLQIKSVSAELYESKRQESEIATSGLATARANLSSSEQELSRIRADREGLISQSDNLSLVAPTKGIISGRYTEAGTTVMAGQTVVEMIDPDSLWVNVRFDQQQSSGLRAGLPAQIKLRSQNQQSFQGQVLRVEVLADAVTEEVLAKVLFKTSPDTLPPIGELTEITVALPPMSALPVVPNASLHQLNGQTGVWLIDDGKTSFAAVKIGTSSLDGQVQILDGLNTGDKIVVYSQQELKSSRRVKTVDRLTKEPQS